MSVKRRDQRSAPTEQLVAERHHERIRPRNRPYCPNRSEILVVELGVLRCQENGERPRRARDPCGAVNDEAFALMRAGIECEQLPDMRPSPHHAAVPEIVVDCLQSIVLVLAYLHTQQDFGVVGGGLEILRDRTLAP